MADIHYEEIFHKAEVGIALNDPTDGTIGPVNQHYAELMGYSRAELAEMKIEEISADDPTFDQAAAMERIQLALEGDPQQFDWLFKRKDGEQLWGEVVLKRTTIGEQDRLLAFVRDISDRKQYERELEHQNQRLDEFASIISHDLRTPLNVASGRLELAREDCDSDNLDEVEEAHDRMRTLIEDVLTLARAGRSVVEIDTVDIEAVATATWRSIGAPSASINIENSVTVRADEARCRQLLENLFRNAINHGGDDVTVIVDTLDDGFIVEDNGQGIPKDAQDEVFESGYSTSPTWTGLGLRIVKQIADAHGWEITLTSGQDQGTRFEFTGVETA